MKLLQSAELHSAQRLETVSQARYGSWSSLCVEEIKGTSGVFKPGTSVYIFWFEMTNKYNIFWDQSSRSSQPATVTQQWRQCFSFRQLRLWESSPLTVFRVCCSQAVVQTVSLFRKLTERTQAMLFLQIRFKPHLKVVWNVIKQIRFIQSFSLVFCLPVTTRLSWISERDLCWKLWKGPDQYLAYMLEYDNIFLQVPTKYQLCSTYLLT